MGKNLFQTFQGQGYLVRRNVLALVGFQVSLVALPPSLVLVSPPCPSSRLMRMNRKGTKTVGAQFGA